MEIALAVPVLMALMLAAVQVALVARAQVIVVYAAREGARAASVSEAAASAAERAVRRTTDLPNVSVATATTGRLVRVTVRSRVHTDVPLIGSLVGDVGVEATATMAVET